MSLASGSRPARSEIVELPAPDGRRHLLKVGTFIPPRTPDRIERGQTCARESRERSFATATMSSLRSQDGAVADHPQIESCQHTDDQANNHVRIQGSCHCSEAEQPGRKDCPNAEREVDPLLPLSERKESAEGNERNRCSDDPGTFLVAAISLMKLHVSQCCRPSPFSLIMHVCSRRI